MAPVGVGLIGCGHIGRFHSRNIRAALATGAVEGRYLAVCDREAERAQQFAAITGAAALASAEELLATPGLGAVYICTETAEHPALVEAAAARGLAIFCEKPLARTLAEVEAMAQAVRRTGVVNQVGLVLRYSPVVTVIRDLCSDPANGPLLTAHLRDDQFFPVRGHYQSTWRGDFARAGGGTLLEHSIHDVDLFRWLFGAITGVRCHTRVTSGHAGIEDLALVTFQHAGGHQTTLTSVWHDVGARRSTRRLEVFFEGAWIATDDDFIGPIAVTRRDEPPVVLSADEVLERYRAIAALSDADFELARAGMFEDVAFLRSVAASRPAFPDFEAALAAHRVVDACYRSAAEGRELRWSEDVPITGRHGDAV
jgi:predicted dehydrogenase